MLRKQATCGLSEAPFKSLQLLRHVALAGAQDARLIILHRFRGPAAFPVELTCARKY